MAETKKQDVTKEEKPAEEKKTVVTTEVNMKTKGVQDMTLPELVGNITTRILTALDGQDQGDKGIVVAAGRRDLRLWYEAQSVENRKDIAKAARKTIENFKSVSEQLWSDIGFLVAQDL